MQVWSAVFDLSKCARRSERPKICPLTQMLPLACSFKRLGTNALTKLHVVDICIAWYPLGKLVCHYNFIVNLFLNLELIYLCTLCSCIDTVDEGDDPHFIRFGGIYSIWQDLVILY